MSLAALERPAVARPDLGRLRDAFATLLDIPSPSLHERACADFVIAKLGSLGLDVHEDDTRAMTGCSAGNLLVRIPAAMPTRDGAVLFLAHLDTDPADSLGRLPSRHACEDEFGRAEQRRAAIAVMLALAEHCAACPADVDVDVELLFTVGSLAGMRGARAFNLADLRSTFGYALDRAGPAGQLAVTWPAQFALQADFRGAASDAGLHPCEGRSAILAAAMAISSLAADNSRLTAQGDPQPGEQQASINVATIAGGGALNEVPERCVLTAEIRSAGDEQAERAVAHAVDLLHDAANRPECDCDVDVSVERLLSAGRMSSAAQALRVAQRAVVACGHEPASISASEGSDAHALSDRGFTAVSLGGGFALSADVSADSRHATGAGHSALGLQAMLELSLALIGEAGRTGQVGAGGSSSGC